MEKKISNIEEMIAQRDYVEKVYNDEIEDITIVMGGICNSCKEK